jgi:hypothetical protein
MTTSTSTWADWTSTSTSTKAWTTTSTKAWTTSTTTAAPKPTGGVCPNDSGKTLKQGGSCGCDFKINCGVKVSSPC